MVESIAGFGPRSEDRPEAVAATLDFLQERLESLGYEVTLEKFGAQAHQVNVSALLKGSQPEQPLIEIGAHWDSVKESPGADDNASGVAGLLEVARCLKGVPRMKRGIRFCFFGEEEVVGLPGSTSHVANLGDEKVDGLIMLEMIGYSDPRPDSQKTPFRVPGVFWPPRTGDFIAVIADRRSTRWAKAFETGAARYAGDLKVYAVRRIGGLIKDAARSDHLPYWKSGRRGLLVTDTANLRNPHYHKDTDTPETLDYAFLANVTRAAAGALEVLAH
ncbi:M20/M25/M40 family metallo-hydrolase [Streptomyces sp. A475]|uniref:M20/M25/M40 family metallo-hydrolase n=1 Tax=Streptomyces sp. A475 TaxID=3131976 RepID=UPI0030C9A8C4